LGWRKAFREIPCQNLRLRAADFQRQILAKFLSGQYLGCRTAGPAEFIAKIRFIGHYRPQISVSLTGSGQENAMRGIGKFSLGMAAALVCVSGSLLLIPSEASAQFNIPGLIIRGGPGPFGYGYRSRSTHHEKSHAKHDDDSSSSSSDKGKEKDATQVESSGGTSAGHSQPAGPAQNTPRSVETDAPSTQSAGANKVYDDQPAFSPSR
jgi:hypothetical protein